MNIQVIASGSSGNCYKVKNSDTTLLLECGIRFQNIQIAFDFQTSEIDACLMTHEHQDHSFAVRDLQKHGITTYMTYGTKNALNLNNHRIKVIDISDVYGKNKIYRNFNVGSFLIQAFQVVHDAREPVGYVIMDKRTHEKLLFVTDTAYLLYTFGEMDYVMVECNYVKKSLDEDLRAGGIPLSLRNRIVRNHMSLETCMDFFEMLPKQSLKEVYLLHLSGRHSDERFMKSQIQRITGVPVQVAG